MTAATPAASTAPLDDTALIELGRASASRPLARRASRALLAVSFVTIAFGALLLPAQRATSWTALAVCAACYALATRVRFEFGGVFAVPTQPVFVATWFLVPPRLLPLLVCASMLAAELPDFLRRRTPPDHVALYLISSWFSVGPALVIFLWGTHQPHFSSAFVYLAALGAQFLFDYLSQYLMVRPVIGISPLAQLRSVLPAFAVDALLAPLGLLVALATFSHPVGLVLVLPVLLLFATFARERQHRIDNALELSTAYRGTAMLLGDVIEADDEYTGSHSRDVVDLVVSVADRLGLDSRERTRAEFAALLHDVGKVKIPAEIINKPGPLDDDEWEIMKTHTIIGEQLLERIGGLLGEVGTIVRSCHERWDGRGYPDALAGDDIPLVARIVCACDAWSAMTTDRSYRKARSFEEAAAELRASAGTHFDPRVVDALLATLTG
ncbi:MAG TPA: HD-GYP domain-containing protein [Gaiellaceae bacterium]|nr:HD-GYP domain-containing protein [Gaiellaceae bacterium]